MKKKLFTVALALIIAVTAITGASLAYLNDTDYAKNVMVTGNVKIVQNERDREGKDFQNGQKLLPAVYTNLSKDLAITDADGQTINVWGESINNELDKFVSVTNTGSEAAYIRTIIAFETCEIYEAGTTNVIGWLHDMYLGVNTKNVNFLYLDEAKTQPMIITVGDTRYALAVCTYADPVAAGATTASSLRQIFLSPDAGNEFYDLIKTPDEAVNNVAGQYDILCLSQAVQAEGFNTAAYGATYALDAAFGEVNVSNATEWFNDRA